MPAFCSPEDHADHEHDLRKHEPRQTDQRTAVAKLAFYCERICQSGVLDMSDEAQLRRLIIEALIAFEMPTKAEREIAP